ncbi:MAG: insulinase family protein [Alistipes sp.]
MPEEIDSERGVISEELRTRDGANWRSTMNMIRAIGKGSKYEQRNLIGYLDYLKSFPHDALRKFYETWYRPDYQAIIVVGDVDVDQVEIKNLMSDIPHRPPAPQRRPHGADNEGPSSASLPIPDAELDHQYHQAPGHACSGQ